MKDNGIIIRQSPFAVKETVDKIAGVLTAKGITIYARINQQAEAAKNNIAINALEFLLFGNPKRGAEVMKENPVAALDLPLKIIAWQDEQLKTWVCFNSAMYLQARFALTGQAVALIDIDPLITGILKI